MTVQDQLQTYLRWAQSAGFGPWAAIEVMRALAARDSESRWWEEET